MLNYTQKIKINSLFKEATAQFSRVKKEFMWIVIGKIFTILGSIIGVRILTNYLEPQLYGQLALGLTIATLVNQVITGPISNGAGRFFSPAKEVKAVIPFMKSLNRIFIQATLLTMIVALTSFVVLNYTLLEEWKWIVLASFIFALLSGYNAISNSVQNADRQRLLVTIHSSIGTWGRFFIAALLIHLLGASSTYAMWGNCLAMVGICLSQFIFIRRTIIPDHEETHLEKNEQYWYKDLKTYSWPFAIWGIFTWTQLASDRWALGIFNSTKEVGLYAVLFQLGYYPVMLAAEMIMQLLTPIIFQRAGDGKDPERVKKAQIFIFKLAGSFFILSAIGFLIVLLIHPYIFKLLVAKEYRIVSYLLPWLMLSGGIGICAQIVSMCYLIRCESNKLLFPKVTTAIFGVCLNFAGAYFYGIQGIIVANICYSCSYLLWMIFGVISRNKKILKKF